MYMQTPGHDGDYPNPTLVNVIDWGDRASTLAVGLVGLRAKKVDTWS